MQKRKMILFFPKERVKQSITYVLVEKFHIKFNILKANVNYNMQGSLLIEVEAEDCDIENAMTWLREQNITVRENASSIAIEYDRCVHCGTCTAVCQVEALHLNERYHLVFDSSKCIECMLCIKACPQRIIKNVFE